MTRPAGESAPPDLATLNRISRRAGWVGAAASAAGVAAAVFVFGWLIAGAQTHIGGGPSPHPTDLVPVGLGLLVGELVRYRRDRRIRATKGPLSTPLVAGLALRQQRRVWAALYSARPSTDPLVRMVTATTARRILNRPRLRIAATGLLAVVVLVLATAADLTPTTRAGGVAIAVALMAVAFLQARTAVVAKVYLSHAGEDSTLPVVEVPVRPPGRLRRRLTPLWADGMRAAPRMWFLRALVTLGAVAVCTGGAIGLLLIADPLQHHLYDISLYLVVIGIMLFTLAMPLELILLGCLLAGAWTFFRGRTSRPTTRLGHT